MSVKLMASAWSSSTCSKRFRIAQSPCAAPHLAVETGFNRSPRVEVFAGRPPFGKDSIEVGGQLIAHDLIDHCLRQILGAQMCEPVLGCVLNKVLFDGFHISDTSRHLAIKRLVQNLHMTYRIRRIDGLKQQALGEIDVIFCKIILAELELRAEEKSQNGPGLVLRDVNFT